MSEKIVLFRDDQELQGDDFTNMQSWLQGGLDHVVLDAINEDKAYSGFAVTKAATTQIAVAAGRLYDDGAVYVRESTVTIDLYNDLPVVQKRYFAVVAYGSTVDEDIQPRNFLIDADTGEAEPQSVAMQRTRYCNISTVKGTESADPQYPTIEATTLLLGYILCDASGIVSVIQNTENEINNLALVAERVNALETWRAILAGMVDTLRTDLANLARQMLLYTPISAYQKLVNVVSDLADRVANAEISINTLSNTYLWCGTDNFLDTGDSDTDGVYDSITYSAAISEGLRFPGGSASSSTALQLLNPTEPLIETSESMILPKPSGSRVRYDCSFLESGYGWIEHRILAHAIYHPTFKAHQLYPSRWRWRCGPHYLPFPGAQVWWHQAWRDPCGHILSFDHETWEELAWSELEHHDENDVRWPRYSCDRWKYYWRDWTHLPYWDRGDNWHDYDHSGNHMAHTFFNSQDGWLTSLTVFMYNTSWGPLNLLITGCDSEGRPDATNQTLKRVVLDADQLEGCTEEPIFAGDIWGADVIPIGNPKEGYYWATCYRLMPVYITPVRIPIPAVFLRAGQHYAFHLDSTFDHKFACIEHDAPLQVHQGHLWHYNGTEMICWLNSARSLRFRLHFATWGRWGAQTNAGGLLRYEINLQSLLLAGGIGSVDVLAESVVPEACQLNFEIKVGGEWRPFTYDPDSPSFSGAPTQLEFRAVMLGTTDLMPAFSLENSQVTLTAAPANAFHHYSDQINTANATSAVKVQARLQGWNGTHHSIDCHLNYGSPSVLHEANTDDLGVLQADGTVLRTWTFNTSSLSAFVIGLHGTSDGVGDRFIVGERKAFHKIS